MPSDDPSSAAGRRLLRSVARALRHRCGVEPGDGVLVAVSGGADSVALLRALHRLAGAPRWRLRLRVAHLQHHWHPDDEGHAGFVAELARRLELPHDRVDLAPPEPGRNLEAAGRTARYRALASLAQTHGCRFVATGHHGDDQLETLLMRLVRGSSARGLRGMAWRRPMQRTTLGPAAGEPGPGLELIRPMLGVTRDQARAWLGALGQPWVDDPLNDDTTRWRNRLRRDVLPVLRELRPDAARKAQELAEHARELTDLLDREARSARRRLTRKTDAGWEMDRRALASLPGAVRGQVLRGALTELGSPGDALGRRALGPLVKAVCDSRGGERRFDLPGGVRVTLGRDRLAAAARAATGAAS